ncbi:MAG TPA: sodium:solute symporter family protein [Ignisphaera sp.]|nr:sodium:solute symporter family protein [Ignisphaera sp.]
MYMGVEAGYVALSIVIGWIVLTASVGALATIRKFRVLAATDAWFVAGRTLGLLILWLSLGANVYSAYTFLGLPGIAAREGAKAWAINIYGMIAYLIGFLIVPLMWSRAKEKNWLTIADAFEDLYSSKALGAFVAITGALWSIPYIQLQIQGIGYIIEETSYGMMDPLTTKIIAFALIAAFTVVGGLVSVAFINALQGAIMLIAVWLVGILAPIIAFGGIGNLFTILEHYAANQPPGAKFSLTLKPQDISWMATLLMAAPLAFWLWPNRIQNIFAAKDVRTVKRNMVLVGIYQVSQIPAILVGLTAIALFAQGIVTMPVYKKPYSDHAFMLVTRMLLPPWVVGLVGAGALAASISTAAAILHVSGALFARNAYQKVFKPQASGRELLFIARIFTALIAIISLVLALIAPGILVYLLLVGYAGIVQFFPPFILGIYKRDLVTKHGALAGMAGGMLTVAYIKIVLGKKPLGMYEGFWGLIVNLILIFLVSLITRKKQ